MNSMNCKVDIPTIPSLPEQTLSVGREFFLNCQGDWPQGLNPESLSFVLSPEEKYSLKLLKFEMRNLQTADLKVVSYQVGPHKWDPLFLTNGTDNFPLGKIEFQVQSVQNPQAPATEPFGPIGPLSLSWPLIYWVIIASLISILLLGLFRFLWLRKQRRLWRKKAQELEIGSTPISQFFSSLRKIQRQFSFLNQKNENWLEGSSVEAQGFLEQLKLSTSVYMTRAFQVPFSEISNRRFLDEVKKVNKDCKEILKPQLDLWRREMGTPLKNSVQVKDLRQLLEQTRQMIESVDEQLQAQKDQENP